MSSLTNLDSSVQQLKSVHVPAKYLDRLRSGNPVVDEIFGGPNHPGFVQGQSIFLTGVPGGGKTTFALQLADMFQSYAGRDVLYNLGEQSDKMVRLAASRIQLKQEFNVSQFEQVDALIKYMLGAGVEVFLQDSLQSLKDGDLRGSAKLLSVIEKLHRFCHDEDVLGVIIGQVTKAGIFAGPNGLEHDTDAHAHLSIDKESGNRVFAMCKNRLGPAGMPYEFSLSAHGLDLSEAPKLLEEAEKMAAQPSNQKVRRDEILAVIRAALLDGDEVSGYCFERLGADCSGGFWRVQLERACAQLQKENYKIAQTKVGGRTHWSIQV